MEERPFQEVVGVSCCTFTEAYPAMSAVVHSIGMRVLEVWREVAANPSLSN